MNWLSIILTALAIVAAVYAVIVLGGMFIDWIVPDDEVF